MEDFTARNIAKFIARSIVASQTASLTERAITDHTQFEEDDKIVDITGTLVGWYVSAKLKPVTDGAVDKVADFVNEKRAARAATKTEKSEEK